MLVFNDLDRFVFDGLSHLMESLLIANARHLRAINNFGVKKMLRNILALQQNIKTIAQESQHADFERAKRYYTLFSLTPRVGPPDSNAPASC